MTEVNKDIDENFTFLENNKEFFYAIIGYAIVFIWGANDLIGGGIKEDDNFGFYKVSLILAISALVIQLIALACFMIPTKSSERKNLVVYTYFLGAITAASSLGVLIMHIILGLKIESKLIDYSFLVLLALCAFTVFLFALRYFKRPK